MPDVALVRSGSAGGWRTRSCAALMFVVVALLAVSACSKRHPEQIGSGWPNIALSKETLVVGGSALSVKPLEIGPGGAVFEVEIENDVDLGTAGLQIQGVTWPFEGWNEEERKSGSLARRTYLLRFGSGGPPIGEVNLSIVWTGSAAAFTWRI